MNNSFEQLYKLKQPNKQQPKTQFNPINSFKKSHKLNKNKFISNHNHHPSQIHHYSIISNNSVQKNLNKVNASKSNHKRSKRQDSTNKKAHINPLLKKCPTIQLTKKQKDIRQAIQYRYDKSRMKAYHFHCTQHKIDEFEDLKVRQIIDQEEEEKFNQLYGYLNQFKVVNLYDYHRYKEETLIIKKEKENHKIIVIKNTKKKRQNSDTHLSFDQLQNQPSKLNKNINTKLILNSNGTHYFSNNPMNIQSQRNHTESSHYQHQRNKSESPAHNFKLEFPSSKVFQKQKSGSKSKMKTENNTALNDKIIASSSVEKNFKSIKDIYLNAISNLANKNTVKSNHKLFKSQNEMKNKGSRSVQYQSQKKGHKNQYHSTKPDKNNSSSALQQNYFSCISSRQNKKEDKNNSCYRKTTKEKLEKTILINEVNPTQWKSIIMKVDSSHKSQNKEQINDGVNQNKKFKLKFNQNGFEKANKNCMNTSNGKFLAYPHSYRQNTKSPKLKKYVINEDEENVIKKKRQKQKMVSSVKNLNNQTYQTLFNSSGMSVYQQFNGLRKSKK